MKEGNKKEKKPIDLKLLGWLAAESFAVVLLFLIGVHGIGNMLIGRIVYIGYVVVGIALLLLAVGLNGGFDSSVPSEDEIVGNMTKQERVAFVEKIRSRKQLAKKIMFVDFPFLCCLLIDTVYVML